MSFKNGPATYATGFRWLAISAMCAAVSACGTTHVPVKRVAHGKEYFSESEYGVKASPRVAYGNNIPKGGGRYMVGNPYAVRGKWYYPKEDFSYNKVGVASWYGSAFHGRQTANGEVYDQLNLTAAHPTFPLPSYARVTNVENGSSVIVRVNDRGPYHSDRIIDLSNKTAQMLDMRDSGTGRVRVQYVGKAPLDGHDMPYLMASYIQKGSRFPGINPGGQIATGVMVASNSKRMTADQLPDPDFATPQRPSKRTATSSLMARMAAPAPVRAPALVARASAPAPIMQASAAPMPASVPVPAAYETTAYAGSTPTSHSSAQEPTMVWGGAMPSVEATLVELPMIGPIPYERPDFTGVPMAGLKSSLVSGYQDAEPVRTVYVKLAFDAVMTRNDGLTQESILSAYKRRNAAATGAQ